MRFTDSVQTPPTLVNTLQFSHQRANPHGETALNAGRANANADNALALAANHFGQGASPRPNVPLLLGDALTLELAHGEKLRGQVVWTAGDDCGLTFDQDVSCALLTGPGPNSQDAARAIPAATSSFTQGANGIRLANASDVSPLNIKSRDDGFMAGLHVKMRLPFGLERRGVVRWSKNNFAEVTIIEPISAEKLCLERIPDNAMRSANAKS